MTDHARGNEDGLSRGQFLAGAISAGGAAAASGLLPSIATAAKTTPPRSYSPGHFALDIDGRAPSTLQDATEDAPAGLVIEEPLAQGAVFVKKHIANIKYNDFKVAMGMGLDSALYDWIQHSFDKSFTRKGGAVIAADFNYRNVRTRTFHDALITELTLPALDAASKDAAKLLVTIAPSSSETSTGGTYPIGATKQKAWLCSNFRLSIDGLDTRRVNTVDSFTIKQKFVEDASGTPAHPGHIEFPDLSFTLSDADAGSVKAWFQDFIVNANNDDTKERHGTLEYLAPDNKTVLLTVTLNKVGIFKGTAESSENNSDRFRADLYVEEMVLTFNTGTG